jgi:hypothetical protein
MSCIKVLYVESIAIGCIGLYSIYKDHLNNRPKGIALMSFGYLLYGGGRNISRIATLESLIGELANNLVNEKRPYRLSKDDEVFKHRIVRMSLSIMPREINKIVQDYSCACEEDYDCYKCRCAGYLKRFSAH